jgi:UDP-glucose 4-epimerase
MGKKVLVTGANGFIGTQVVIEATNRGFGVIAFDRHQSNHHPEGTETFLGDIRDFESINEAVQKVDYAINLAGILGTQELVNDPIPAVQTNTIGCLNFLKAMKSSKFHAPQGVEIGIGNHYMNNPYSISKDMAERFTFMYNKEHGTKVAIVRGFNAYGPRQHHKPVRKMVPYFIVQALNGENLEVYGDGEQIADMIHVNDLARILVDAAVKDHGVYDSVLEAGTGIRSSVNQVAEAIKKAIGNPDVQITHTEMRPGETKGAVVLGDPSTLKPLGEQKFISLDEGMKQTVEWYRENYDWKK